MTISRTTTASVSRARSVSDKARLGLGTALALTLAGFVQADTLPTGGQVVHGTAQINTPTPGSMAIHQQSDRAIVNWNSFSIGQGNRVDITQPNADAAILNRVTGDTTSQIHGQLNANGRVFVVNPNGVFIGKTGSVNSGSFVASTLNMRNDDFVTGNLVFEGNGNSATVSNAGTVQVVTGGYAALIGGKVKNSGTIQAPLGFVGLGAGERVTLDLAGDGFLQVAIPSDSDDDGLEALIENSGTIQANGGTVQISAATARNAARHAINMSGVIEARTVSGRNGRVTLGGGGGGKVTVRGKVRTRATRPAIQVTQSARPTARPARGGDITITGREITLAGATLDASGADGGGSIRVGGDLQGGPGLLTADILTVDAATVLTADALGTGDGGRVIAWSDLSTDFNGNISVRGGTGGGDGGFAEVSGKQDLRYNGFTDALAPKGAPGDLLLDPADIEIVSGAVAFNQILDTDLEAQLAGANVLIGTSVPNLPDALDYPSSVLGFGELPGDAGTITVTALADVTWNSGTSLTLLADQDIVLNGQVTPNNGTLTMDAGGRVVVNGTVTAAPGGTVNVDAGTDFTIAGSGTLNVTGGTLSSIASDIEIDGTFIGQSATSTFEASNSLVVENANTFNGIEGNTTLEASDVTIARELQIGLGVLDVQAGTATVTPAGSITGASGQSRINTGGPIILDGPILTPGGETRIIAFNDTATPGTGGQVQTGLFVLGSNTTWNQNALGGALAGFDATNFVLSDPSSRFLRVLDGDGTAPGTAFEVTDIYGLQGVGSMGTGATWQLANDIDASPTLTWSSLAAPVNGQVDQGFAPLNFDGTLLGNRFTISNLFARRFGSTAGGRAGLFNDLGSTAFVTQLNLANVDLAGVTVGGVAASSDGSVLGVSVEGQLEVYHQALTSSFGGGIVGRNNSGTIGGSFTDVTIFDTPDPSEVTTSPSQLIAVGGIAGLSDGNIVAVRSSGDISFDSTEAGFAGGIVGLNQDDIRDAYSNAAISGVSGGADELHLGSITGTNAGELTNVIANGPVSMVGGVGTGGIGAVTGTDDISDLSIRSSFFSVAGTGQTVSGQNGENTGIDNGFGQFEGAIPDAEVIVGEPFVALTDTPNFVLLTALTGWDYQNVWAYPENGVDQARLVAVDPVIGAANQPPAVPQVQYQGTGTSYTATDSVFSGGPAAYLFGPLGDTGNLNAMDSQMILSGTDVGSQTYRYPSTYTSDLGQAFSVRSLNQDITITPAPLTITVGNIEKVFGTELTFANVPLTAGPFFGSDGITGGNVISDGAAANATISDTPYSLSVNGLTGPGLSNYAINIVAGTVLVTGRALDIIINSFTKTYGETLAFAGDEFTVAGLDEGDSVTSLTLSSPGAIGTASVSDSAYVVNGSDPVGVGLENYVINIVPGQLTVVPAPLTITADDQEKPFGTEFVFTGTEFTVTGLLNDDAIESATLTSTGAPADAPFTGADGVAIVITDPMGTGLENYAVTLVNGFMVIAPGNLTITANDQTKIYGDVLNFDGTEFTVTGLAEGDSVDSVTLTSAGAAGTAQVGDGPFTITPSDAIGTGLEKYTLVFADGSLTVIPAPLTVTANDQSKPQGFALSFDGTEFTTAGLQNGDTVDSAVLASAGAEAAALAADGPYAITIGGLEGSGLENYTVTAVDGTLTVENIVRTGRINPLPPGSNSLPNPPDVVTIAFPGSTGNAARGIVSAPTTGPGGTQQSLPDAQATFEVVDDISTDLEIAVQSCGSADQDFTNYMACLSDSLDTYANALDEISNDLPESLETVSATIRTAAEEVRIAQARAARRLSTATSATARRAIQREAIAEARGAISNAQSEIRKAISLIRADDDGVQAVQEQTGARIIQAFDTVDSALARATEL